MRPGVGVMLVIPSIWGHWAGGEQTLRVCDGQYLTRIHTGPGQSVKDAKWLDEKLRWFFGRARTCPRRINRAKSYAVVEDHIQPSGPEVEASTIKVVQDELHTLPLPSHDVSSEIKVMVEVTLSGREGSNTTKRMGPVHHYY
jgi:hypothetical protein